MAEPPPVMTNEEILHARAVLRAIGSHCPRIFHDPEYDPRWNELTAEDCKKMGDWPKEGEDDNVARYLIHDNNDDNNEHVEEKKVDN
jgi:hypothetical protein